MSQEMYLRNIQRRKSLFSVWAGIRQKDVMRLVQLLRRMFNFPNISLNVNWVKRSITVKV